MKHLIQNGLTWLGVCLALVWMALWPWAGALAQTQATVQNKASPVGLWQSIDDASGKPRAQIRLSLTGDVVTGRIIASYAPTVPSVVQVCERCSDARKNQPLIGMEMIRNMRPTETAGVWTGGDILDPDSGKLYRLQLTLQEGGKKLQVRGYIGPFFRNQIWLRLGE